MKTGTCRRIRRQGRTTKYSCLCKSDSGVVSFKKGDCPKATRAKSAPRCKLTKKGKCLCKTPSGGYTFAAKSRCGK